MEVVDISEFENGSLVDASVHSGAMELDSAGESMTEGWVLWI